MPRKWFSCVAALDIVRDDANAKETYFHYTLTRFTNSDANITCEAALGLELRQSGSSSVYLPSATAGADAGLCTATLDMPPVPVSGSSDAGFWMFSADKRGPVAEYMDADPGHPLDGAMYRFGENDCSVLACDRDGQWQESSLGDFFR